MFSDYQTSLEFEIPTKPHPISLVESEAMGAVKIPQPTYQPLLPKEVVEQGLISQAQLEAIVLAGEAHSQYLPEKYLISEDSISYRKTPDSDTTGTKIRRGFFLADGTGLGKTRTILGVIIDNWLQGRTKAVIITVNPKLIPDLTKEWQELGGDQSQIIPLKKFPQGNEIKTSQGILVATYGQIRTQAKANKRSRVEQIVDWVGSDFNGVVVFDESHNLGNAVPEKGERGFTATSLQAISGLKLQNLLPEARVLYASATAFTKLENLVYANRLGLWNNPNSGFSSQADFINKFSDTGLSGLELIAQNAKAMGVYCSRTLSFEGIEYEQLVHELTPEQIRIYNSYAEIFREIGLNIHKCLSVCNIADNNKTYNSSARRNIIGRFESLKQRFFELLLINCKLPTVIKHIQERIDAEEAVIIQLINTNESMLKQQLDAIPPEEWENLNVDITPRETIGLFLENCFPTDLYKIEYNSETERYLSRPELDNNGQNIKSREAIEIKDRLIELLANLAPISNALDTILFHFGEDNVAEITGRSIRLIKTHEGIIKVQKRSSGANKADEKAFQGDKKRILIFSSAGGTGRSYHASKKVKNQRKRNHYLLQVGWNVYTASQGFGRSHRSNQRCAPKFIVCTTNLAGEKRFTGTVAKRLASLGALSKGQSSTDQQLIDTNENSLDTLYGKIALRRLLERIDSDSLLRISRDEFQAWTGIITSYLEKKQRRVNSETTVNQFLNRTLAISVSEQNYLVNLLLELTKDEIAKAIAENRYDNGIKTINASRISIEEEIICWQDQQGNQTKLIYVKAERKIKYNQINSGHELYLNEMSGDVAFVGNGYSRICLDTGDTIETVKLSSIRKTWYLDKTDFHSSMWKKAKFSRVEQLWNQKIAQSPVYDEKYYYLLSGLLLPIWGKISKTSNIQLRKVKTADREFVGLLVSNPELTLRRFDIEQKSVAPTSTSNKIELIKQKHPVQIGKYTLVRRKIKLREVVEVEGFQQGEIDYLCKLGCKYEVVRFKGRVFLFQEDLHNFIESVEEIAIA